MHFSQLLSRRPASCWEKTADNQDFLWSYKFVELHAFWLTYRPDRCPRQSTDASDMTGSAMSSLAVRAWLDQVIARMKDWVLLSTWHIHLTSPTSPLHLPLLNSQTLPAPLLSASSEGNPCLKASSPPPPISLLCPLPLLSPEEVRGIAGISQHPQGAPISLLFPHDYWRAASRAVPSLSSSCSRLIPTDRHFSTSEASPLRMEKEVLVKINLPSPLHLHLRHHAEKTTSTALPLPIFQTRIEPAEVRTYLLFIAALSFLDAAGQGCIPEMILKSCSILSRLNLQL